MTSNKFPPIPPYYPAPPETGWNYPLPGAGFPAPEPASGGLHMGQFPGVPEKTPLQKVRNAATTGTNAIAYFHFEGRPVRYELDRRGEPWFAAMDVVLAVGALWNGTHSIQHVPEEWRGVISVVTPGGRQSLVALSEHGVYFYLTRSDKPKALPLQKWISGEVLPSIRKTGGYGNREPALSLLDEIVANPQKAQAAIEAQAKMIQSLASQNEGLADNLWQSQNLNERFKLGINSLVALMAEPEGICLRDAANQLGQPQHAFNMWLKDKGWIYKNERAHGKKSRWKPHASSIAQGVLGDNDWVRNKITDEVTMYSPEMGFINPNDYFIFKEVTVTRAGMIKILQYEDFPNPNAYAVQLTRKKYGL